MLRLRYAPNAGMMARLMPAWAPGDAPGDAVIQAHIISGILLRTSFYEGIPTMVLWDG